MGSAINGLRIVEFDLSADKGRQALSCEAAKFIAILTLGVLGTLSASHAQDPFQVPLEEPVYRRGEALPSYSGGVNKPNPNAAAQLPTGDWESLFTQAKQFYGEVAEFGTRCSSMGDYVNVRGERKSLDGAKLNSISSAYVVRRRV